MKMNYYYDHPCFGPADRGFEEDIREGMIAAIMLKLAKSNDSPKQINKNINTAIAYADRLKEILEERSKRVSIMKEHKEASGELKYATDRLANRQQCYDKSRLECEKVAKDSTMSESTVNYVKKDMEDRYKEVQEQVERVAKAQKRYDDCMTAAKKLNMKIEA